ncbi:MAG: 8-oxo-dGTP diphosphatase [Ignavibacteriaceae bacterium]|nr:8-oxo-dGTP diphosphatase [Ignavibacteriaceae bacterium]
MMKLATLCYIKNPADKSTLMLHRIKKENDMHKDKWNGLGGKLHAGESPEECVIREIEEESGLRIKSPELRGFITFPAFDGFDDWYVFVFTAIDYSGILIDSPEGNLEWVPDKELYNLPLWDGDKIFFKWIEEKKFFSAKFNYNNGRLIDYTVSFY